MHVYSYRPGSNQSNVRRKRSILKLILGLLLIAFGLFIILSRQGNPSQSNGNEAAVANEQNRAQPASPEPEPLPAVQQVVEDFITSSQGDYGVVVTDLATGQELGAFKVDREYFAASLYKIYVAYLGYIDIQNGKHSLEQPFLGSWSRKDCLDKMIRESHSPCAEKLWAEQGKTRSTERLKDLGLLHTNMEGLTTTAQDIDIILRRLYERKDLNDAHTELFLKSMKENIYRDVLPVALPELEVMDKVGFRELVEYHDVGIVTLPNGRQVAVTLLTRNAGTKRMVDLTKTIFEPLIAAAR